MAGNPIWMLARCISNWLGTGNYRRGADTRAIECVTVNSLQSLPTKVVISCLVYSSKLWGVKKTQKTEAIHRVAVEGCSD